MKRTKAKELLNKVCYNGRTYYVRHVEGNEEGKAEVMRAVLKEVE